MASRLTRSLTNGFVLSSMRVAGRERQVKIHALAFPHLTTSDVSFLLRLFTLDRPVPKLRIDPLLPSSIADQEAGNR